MSFLEEAPPTAPAQSHDVRVAAWPSYLALGSSLLSVVLLLGPHSNVGLLITGYVFGAVITPVFAVVHRTLYEARQKSPWFVRNATAGRIVAASLVIGLPSGVAHAWLLATELAKR